MKKSKTKFALILLAGILLAYGIITITNSVIDGYQTVKFATTWHYERYFGDFWGNIPQVFIPGAKAREYNYNESVPESVILSEVDALSKRFDFTDKQKSKWIKILRCEATCTQDYCEKSKLDNLAKNNTSTAVGVGQYLIKTWYATESWKQHRKARTDYKASLWEMALDLKGGEIWRWSECADKLGYMKF